MPGRFLLQCARTAHTFGRDSSSSSSKSLARSQSAPPSSPQCIPPTAASTATASISTSAPSTPSPLCMTTGPTVLRSVINPSWTPRTSHEWDSELDVDFDIDLDSDFSMGASSPPNEHICTPPTESLGRFTTLDLDLDLNFEHLAFSPSSIGATAAAAGSFFPSSLQSAGSSYAEETNWVPSPGIMDIAFDFETPSSSVPRSTTMDDAQSSPCSPLRSTFFDADEIHSAPSVHSRDFATSSTTTVSAAPLPISHPAPFAPKPAATAVFFEHNWAKQLSPIPESP